MLINAFLVISNTFCDYCNSLTVLLPNPQHLFIKNSIVPHESNSLNISAQSILEAMSCIT